MLSIKNYLHFREKIKFSNGLVFSSFCNGPAIKTIND